MKKSVWYLGYYSSDLIKEQRKSFPSSNTKMNYVCSVLNKCGFDFIHLVSASGTMGKKAVPAGKVKLDKNTDIRKFFSFGNGGMIKRFINRLLLKIQLFFYLVFRLSRDDYLLVYHSLSYMKIVALAKKIRKFRLIEEVEEVYSDVNEDVKNKRAEYNFFKYADAFVFSTKLLNEKINLLSKPYSVANGSYKSEYVRNDCIKSLNNKNHVVYAGTLDARKGGAYAAVEAALALSGDYHIHILGFGSENEKKSIIEKINEVKTRTSCDVTYEGEKRGEDYIRFIQSCQVGLSTQNPNAAFNDTSFPSKILVYLANGLNVVSVRIPVVQDSDIGEFITYYDKQNPSDIAKAIEKSLQNPCLSGRELLKKLDDKFIKEIMEMLNEL